MWSYRTINRYQINKYWFNTIILIAIILVFNITNAMAQGGASSASMSLSRANNIPQPDSVVIEEIINYHRHGIALPQGNEKVALDLRWGNEMLPQNGAEAVFQIGLATRQVINSERTNLRPLNLTLVIDKSGSMSGNKIERVKESLVTMLSQLRESDILSIVTFDSSAQVLIPARPLKDKFVVQQAIMNIVADGGTEIYDGLMLGYQQASINFDTKSTNRVVLLTDGLSEPKSIINDSRAYNKRGIDLATIGIGGDVNIDLLRELAKQGHGLFHFVEDTRDIKKIFVKELESLISPIGRNVSLSIDLDPHLKLIELYGYKPAIKGNNITINLDDMNSGLTEVVLIKFANDGSIKDKFPEVHVTLSYFDIDQNSSIVIAKNAAPLNGKQRLDRNIDKPSQVKKNGNSNSIDQNSNSSDQDSSLDDQESYSMSELETKAVNSTAKNNSKNNSSKKREKPLVATQNNLSAFIDEDVKKNYAIACLALALRNGAINFNKTDYAVAGKIINDAIADVNSLYSEISDKDILRVYEILQKCQNTVNQYIKVNTKP